MYRPRVLSGGVHSGADRTAAGAAAPAVGAGPGPAAAGDARGRVARVQSSATAETGLSKDLFVNTCTPVEHGRPSIV